MSEPGDTRPTTMARLMGLLRWLLLAAAIGACLYAFVVVGGVGVGKPRGGGAVTSSTSASRFHCPMHPQVVSDAPGECPICHMDLEPIAADAPRAEVATYTCPMHPEVVAHAPGVCPICKMALEKVERPAPSGPADGGASSDAGGPAGTAPVQLSMGRIQSIGVRMATATEREIAEAVRVTATVQASESGAAEVHVRTPGFVERIAVQETGVAVTRGQELFAVYSPEIYQAQTELLATRGWSGDGGATSLGARARRKLELLGMSPEAIERVVTTGEPQRAVPVTAPAAGIVRRKNVVLGSYVTPEAALYEIVDLSRVYVVGELYPRDVDRVPVGTSGTFTSASRRDVAIPAKVDLVYPSASPDARTVQVRMSVKNERRALVPGELGAVVFALPKRKVTLVPRDAVVDTGRETYVFVDAGGGTFAPRAVTIGAEVPEGLEIRSGVAPGERVVSGATFLLDSESRLRASIGAAP